MVKSKACTKCGKQKLLSVFNKSKQEKDGLQYHCKNCLGDYRQAHKVEMHRYNVKYIRTHRIERDKRAIEYKKTLVGRLCNCFHQAKQRCNNTKCRCYKNYGGRGIKMKFKSSQKFINHIIDDLGYNTLKKLKGLTIDRIDNNGHYEKGNIRFVTTAENNRNRVKRKR